MRKTFTLLLSLALLSGCGAYRWTSPVPSDMRTVFVPTFRNETDVVELGAVATRQTLRELQREGTFRIAPREEAALELQAVLKAAPTGLLNYKRSQTMRAYEHRLSLVAEVSLVDRRNGKMLFDGRPYRAETTFFSDTDIVTARRDASGRLAEDLARQIVDDVAGCGWGRAGADGKPKGKE